MSSDKNDSPYASCPLFGRPSGPCLEPYTYLRRITGEFLQNKIMPIFNHWLELPKEKLDILSEIIHLLIGASLIIDDIQDDSKLRKGYPAPHCIFGIGQSVNVATYLSFLGLEKLLTLEHSLEATQVYTEYILELCRGQGIDIYWRDLLICPTEEEYKEMVISKTGGSFYLTVLLMQVYSKNKCNLKPLLELLAVYLQIINDYENLASNEEVGVNHLCSTKSKKNCHGNLGQCYMKFCIESKGFYEDIEEGKFSFPIIHAILANRNDTQVLNILKLRTSDKVMKRYCVDYIKKMGSFEYTQKVICQLEEQIEEEIQRLGGNPSLKKLMTELQKIYR